LQAGLEENGQYLIAPQASQMSFVIIDEHLQTVPLAKSLLVAPGRSQQAAHEIGHAVAPQPQPDKNHSSGQTRAHDVDLGTRAMP